MPSRIAGSDAFGLPYDYEDSSTRAHSAFAPNDGSAGLYGNAGLGVGHDATVREPVVVWRSGPRTALGLFVEYATIGGALLALSAFVFGFCDVIATGDTPGVAQEKMFFWLQDSLVNALHTLSLKLFASPDALGAFDTVISAAGYCAATLTGVCAGDGATVAATLEHLVHLGGF